MTISTEITANGAIKCITEIDGRRYRSKYHGCNKAEAQKRFRQRVEAAETKLMEASRQELIDVCLNCQIPVEKCKGNCKIKQTIKIKRGKGVK